MRIAVMALQGAFIEHRQMLARLGVETFEVRQPADWQQPKDGLILPGGESTVQMRLLRALQLLEPVRSAIVDGLPVFGTCAGMILLGEGRMGTMDIRVRRNAYGRQLGSFHAEATVEEVGDRVPLTFVRAPFVEAITSPACRSLCTVGGHIVAVRQHRQLATSFHPELDGDTRLHEYFLRICEQDDA